MKTVTIRKQGEWGGSMIVLCLVTVTVVTIAAGITALVAQGAKVTLSRSNMISAREFAQGAAVIACSDLNTALMKTAGTLGNNLQTASNPYSRVSASAAGVLYQRTIAAPFSNQTATAKILLPDTNSPTSAKITGTASVGDVTQTATVNVRMAWGYPAAIVSVNAGTTDTNNTKQKTSGGTSVGTLGNVAIDGDVKGPIVIDGGSGLAVMANGRINYDTNYLKISADSYSMTNYGTANEIPDYTGQGTSNTLFQLDRYMAVADLTTNGYNPTTKNNHFTNLSSFITAAKLYTNAFTKAMEGVVVVDVKMTDLDLANLTANTLPNGINIKGTLLLNFTGTGWDPVSEKIMVTAAINVNAANLSKLVPADPSTYASGYPPVYTTASRNPININITSKGFENFKASDDMPAVIYSTGCLDIHGNCNISGVLYTPCYVEMENLNDGQIQYIKGMVIMGNGMYYKNTKAATNIISYDTASVDSLATFGNSGKQVTVSYWEP